MLRRVRAMVGAMRTRTLLWTVLAGVLATFVPLALAAPDPDVPGRGNDISWPQCSPANATETGPLPGDSAFGIVGTQNGRPNTANPCLNRQWTWALGRPEAPMQYLLSGNPGPRFCGNSAKRQLPASECRRWKRGSLADASKDPRPCSGAKQDDGCAYDYGYQAALNALANADAAQVTLVPVTWWIDVEPTGYFRTESNRKAQNVIALQGTRDALLTRPDRVARVGIYASPGEWATITAKDTTTFADLLFWWPVGPQSPDVALSRCSMASPTGGAVELVQWVDKDEAVGKDIDADARCTPLLRLTTVPSTVVSGERAVVAGAAAAGATIAVSSGEVGRDEQVVSTTTAGPDGTWATDFSLRFNGYVTVRDGTSEINRRINATTAVAITRAAGAGRTRAGLCRVRLDGGVSPWIPGQMVKVRQGALQVGYAHTRKRAEPLGSFSMVLSLRCGKPVTVVAELPGKVGGVTFFRTSYGAPRLLKPR
jgi:hypothetical protein